MNIEGTYTLQASPEQVWQSLMDPEVLLNTVPGIEHLEKIDASMYEMTMQVKHAPLKGSYQGRITISEEQYPYHYRITVQGGGRQNSFSGSGSVHLNGQSDTTVIAYKGNLVQEKRSPLLPPAVIKGAAKLLIQQFFTMLAAHLRTRIPVATIGTERSENGKVIQQAGGTITVLPATLPEEQPGLLRTLIQRSNLGGGDPQEEERLELFIQRIGVVVALLFLIWLGTRIPRKR